MKFACQVNSSFVNLPRLLIDSELKLSIKILNRSRGNWEYDHCKYSRRDWIAEVGSKDTQIGYFDWAEHRLECELEDLAVGMNDEIARTRERRRQ